MCNFAIKAKNFGWMATCKPVSASPAKGPRTNLGLCPVSIRIQKNIFYLYFSIDSVQSTIGSTIDMVINEQDVCKQV